MSPESREPETGDNETSSVQMYWMHVYACGARRAPLYAECYPYGLPPPGAEGPAMETQRPTKQPWIRRSQIRRGQIRDDQLSEIMEMNRSNRETHEHMETHRVSTVSQCLTQRHAYVCTGLYRPRHSVA